jgi:hypothetical protein
MVEEITMSQLEQAQAITIEEAKALMQQERDQRGQACNQAIQSILAKFNCALVAIPSITEDGRVIARVQIIPRDLR